MYKDKSVNTDSETNNGQRYILETDERKVALIGQIYTNQGITTARV